MEEEGKTLKKCTSGVAGRPLILVRAYSAEGVVVFANPFQRGLQALQLDLLCIYFENTPAHIKYIAERECATR
jgi:hypothetical protein